MKKFLPVFLGTIVVGNTVVYADEKVHWDYTDPTHWAELSDDFEMCGIGKNQSPVNLTHMIEAEMKEISFAYQEVSLSETNNKHTIVVNYQNSGHIIVDENTFELGQFHFHAPSEHQIESQSFPLEAHLVHKDAKGNLAVVGIMFTEGEANPFLEKVWQYMPTEEGQKDAPKEVTVNAIDLLPENKDYYRYEGSLTTPPCSEGVRWMIMKQPVTASAEQIKQFKAVMHHDDNRPVQPINARVILK